MKLFDEKRIKEWRELSQAALDGRLGPDWHGDPDGNVCQLGRAVDRLLDERERLVAVAKAAYAGPCRHADSRHDCDLCGALQDLGEFV